MPQSKRNRHINEQAKDEFLAFLEASVIRGCDSGCGIGVKEDEDDWKCYETMITKALPFQDCEGRVLIFSASVWGLFSEELEEVSNFKDLEGQYHVCASALGEFPPKLTEMVLQASKCMEMLADEESKETFLRSRCSWNGAFVELRHGSTLLVKPETKFIY